MAITHSIAARNAAADAVVDLVDGGTANASGKVRIKTSGDATLVDLNMSNPAFGAAVAGTATANAISDGTAGATGTASKFDVLDRDENVVFSGSVTATGGGGDMELDNTSIANGQTVSITSMTYTGESA